MMQTPTMSPEYYEARILAERVGEFRAQRKIDRDLRQLGEPSVAAEMVGHDAITVAQEPALHAYLAGVLHASGRLAALYDCAVSHAYAWDEMDVLVHLDPVVLVGPSTGHELGINRTGVNWFRPLDVRHAPGERVDLPALLVAWRAAVPESNRGMKTHWWGRRTPSFFAADGRPVTLLADAEGAARRVVRRALAHVAHAEPRPLPDLGAMGRALGEYALGIVVREELTEAAHECAVRHAQTVGDPDLLAAVGEATPVRALRPVPAPALDLDPYAHAYHVTPEPAL